MENGSRKVENGNRKREVAWHLSATVSGRSPAKTGDLEPLGMVGGRG